MVEHSGETSASTNFFHGKGREEGKGGGGVGQFCQNYPEITCFFRVRFSRYEKREIFGNSTCQRNLFIDYFFSIDTFYQVRQISSRLFDQSRFDISNEYNNFSFKPIE